MTLKKVTEKQFVFVDMSCLRSVFFELTQIDVGSSNFRGRRVLNLCLLLSLSLAGDFVGRSDCLQTSSWFKSKEKTFSYE